MNPSGVLLKVPGTELVVSCVDGEYRVQFAKAEVKNGIFLRGECGRGSTFEMACEDYMMRISGQTIVFDAYSSNRREVTCLF